MKKIIKQILREDRQEQFLNKVMLLIKDDYPIFKKLDDYGFNLSEDELIYVLYGIFGEPVIKSGYKINKIYNKNRNLLYEENNGYWQKREYDENGNQIYYERSDGYREKYEYDENGNLIYYEDSSGYWEKYEYDENNNIIFYEYSDGEIEDNR